MCARSRIPERRRRPRSRLDRNGQTQHPSRPRKKAWASSETPPVQHTRPAPRGLRCKGLPRELLWSSRLARRSLAYARDVLPGWARGHLQKIASRSHVHPDAVVVISRANLECRGTAVQSNRRTATYFETNVSSRQFAVEAISHGTIGIGIIKAHHVARIDLEKPFDTRALGFGCEAVPT